MCYSPHIFCFLTDTNFCYHVAYCLTEELKWSKRLVRALKRSSYKPTECECTICYLLFLATLLSIFSQQLSGEFVDFAIQGKHVCLSITCLPLKLLPASLPLLLQCTLRLCSTDNNHIPDLIRL